MIELVAIQEIVERVQKGWLEAYREWGIAYAPNCGGRQSRGEVGWQRAM